MEALTLREPLTFAVFGDSRDNPGVFERVLKQVSQDKEIAFAIHLGDLVNRPEPKQFRLFFRQVQANLAIPLVAVIGNHESKNRQAELYTRLFGPRYYSFRLSGHYFLMLDATTKAGPDEIQLEWLEGELQKGLTCRTRLVFMHIPPCDPRSGERRHCLAGDSAARLMKLFKKYKVSQVFAAHIHACFTGELDGVPYVITGGAGAPLYREVPGAAFYHFLKITLSDNRVGIQVQRVAETPQSLTPRDLISPGAFAHFAY
jgi:hypothetical protein